MNGKMEAVEVRSRCLLQATKSIIDSKTRDKPQNPQSSQFYTLCCESLVGNKATKETGLVSRFTIQSVRLLKY